MFSIGANYAVALRLAGRFADAEKVYQQIKVEESNNPQTLVNYAILLVDHLKNKDKALKVIDKIRFVNSDSGLKDRMDALEKRAQALSASPGPKEQETKP